MTKIDTLYSNVFMLGTVVYATGIPFMQLFEYFESTGIPEADELFTQFMAKGSEFGNEKFFLDATQRLSQEYPEAIFLKVLIDCWLHVDMNIFFYGADKIAITYLIVRHVQSGGGVTDAMRAHIAGDFLASANSRLREYLELIHLDLAVTPDAAGEVVALNALFPDQVIADQFELPIVVQEKIQRAYLETADPLADVDRITSAIQLYRSVLATR